MPPGMSDSMQPLVLPSVCRSSCSAGSSPQYFSLAGRRHWLERMCPTVHTLSQYVNYKFIIADGTCLYSQPAVWMGSRALDFQRPVAWQKVVSHRGVLEGMGLFGEAGSLSRLWVCTHLWYTIPKSRRTKIQKSRNPQRDRKYHCKRSQKKT